jgi:hypothetical protein
VASISANGSRLRRNTKLPSGKSRRPLTSIKAELLEFGHELSVPNALKILAISMTHDDYPADVVAELELIVTSSIATHAASEYRGLDELNTCRGETTDVSLAAAVLGVEQDPLQLPGAEPVERADRFDAS